MREEGGRLGRFEAAADATVDGDLETLERLLAEDPDLVRCRSAQEHACTLLHYATANGCEDERQRTPANAVEVARLLLERGADPDDTGAWGGGPRGTPLISLVTSHWPARAGLQAALVDAFARAGARVNGVEDDGAPLDFALGFGYTAAARALRRHGARVTRIVHRAGLGDLDGVRGCFDESGELLPEHREPSGWCTRRERGPTGSLDWAFLTAARHRALDVADFLLERGANVGAHGDQGFTALHTAAWNADLELVEWLLARSAPLEHENAYGGTVLDGTCWGAANASAREHDHIPVLERLVAAGAALDCVSPFPTGNERIDEFLRSNGR